MQTTPVLWIMDALVSMPHAMRRPLQPDTFGGSQPRCRRCDILLGLQPCPNPQCREPHGHSAGDLCTWCCHEV